MCAWGMEGVSTNEGLAVAMEIVQKKGLILRKGACQACMGWQMEVVEHFYYFSSSLNTVCVNTVLD